MNRSFLSLVAGLGACWVAGAGAQSSQFQFTGGSSNLPVGSFLMAVSVDIDGDGDLDVVMDGHVLGNVGGGRFERRVAFPGLPLLVLDFDGDGDMDLVAGDYSGGSVAIALFANDGSGTFINTMVTLGTLHSFEGCVLDHDGDGDTDVLVSGRLWENVGAGGFAQVVLPFPPNAYSIGGFAADFDGDGDDDLLMTGGSLLTAQITTYFFRNTGQGFIDDSSVALAGAPFEFVWGVGDWDADGDIDAVASTGGVHELVLNDGTGRLGASRIRTPAGGQSAYVGRSDLDADGVPELYFGSAGQRLSAALVGVNSLIDISALLGGVRDAGPVLAGDWDGDGSQDLLVGGNRHQLLLQGIRRPLRSAYVTPEDVLVIGAPGFPYGPGVDLDGDGLLDGIDSDNRVLWSEPGEPASVSAPLPGLPAGSAHLTLDYDNDGDLDVLGWPGTTTALVLLRNDGARVFTDVSMSLPQPVGVGLVTVGDFDGGGRQDLLLETSNGPFLMQNTSSGFVLNGGWGIPLVVLQNVHKQVADIDGDGYDDLLLGRARTEIFRGGPTGLMGATNTFLGAPAALRPLEDQVLADIDGDGLPDLLRLTAVGIFELWRNTGTPPLVGVLAPSLTLPGPDAAMSVLDIDDDGDLDIAARQGRTDTLLLRNDSMGWTTLTDHVLGYVIEAHGDWDGDGDVDLLGADNLHRHLRAPRILRPGNGYEILVDVRTGQGSVRAALVGIATALAPNPITLPAAGTWRLDPGATTILPFVPIAAGSTTGSLSLNIPASPTLVGTRVWTQGIVQEPTSLATTAVTVMRIY